MRFGGVHRCELRGWAVTAVTQQLDEAASPGERHRTSARRAGKEQESDNP